MKTVVVLLLASLGVFGKVANDTIPKFAVKFNPVALLIEIDPHFQFSGEYFLNSRRSIQGTVGFGNYKVLQNSKNDKTFMLRFEHRGYFRPFTSRKKGRGYWGQEIMYKNALERKVAHNLDDIQAPSVDYRLDVNVTAAHLKLGHEFVGPGGFPVIDVFIGLGGRAYKNINQNLPQGYDFITNTMFNRLEGRGTSLSAVFGVGFGFGSRR